MDTIASADVRARQLVKESNQVVDLTFVTGRASQAHIRLQAILGCQAKLGYQAKLSSQAILSKGRGHQQGLYQDGRRSIAARMDCLHSCRRPVHRSALCALRGVALQTFHAIPVGAWR